MIVAVTGAAGHIGASLVRALLRRGDTVRALVHSQSDSLAGLEVDLVRGDVCDAASLRDCFRGAEVVYHLAGHISVSRRDSANVCQVNGDGVRGVVQACIACGVSRLVHFSSIHAVVDPLDGACVDEGTPLVGEGAPAYD